RRPEEIAVALTGPDRPRAPLAVLAGAVVVARRDRPRPVRPPSGACGGQEVGGAVRALPREVGQLTPEVAVGRRLPVDRPQQVEVADDRGGAQVEHLTDRREDPLDRDLLGAEGLDEDTDGSRLAD